MSATIGILASGLGVLLLIPVLWRIRGRRFDCFEPIVLFSVAWGVMFVVRPLAMLIRGDWVYFGLNVRGTLGLAILLALVGGIGFIVGYEIPLGGRLARAVPRAQSRAHEGPVLVAAILTGLLGILLLIVFLPSSRGFSMFDPLLQGRGGQLGVLIRGSSTYLWYGSLLVIPASLASVALALRTRAPLAVVTAVAFTAVALVRTVPVGDRMALLVFGGGLLVFAYVRRERRPSLLALVSGLMAALAVSYFILVVRYPDSRGNVVSDATSIVSRPQQIFSPVLGGADSEMAPVLAGALTVIPDRLRYGYGRYTLGDLVSRPIPRQVWPGKPYPPGQKIVQTVWPVAYSYGFDPAFSPITFLYWDWGVAGVLVGMAVFGLVCRVMYEGFLVGHRRVEAQLLFSAGVWFAVVGARNDPVDTTIQATFLLLPLACILVAGLIRWPFVVRASVQRGVERL
jgi:hypothetical protein